MSENSKVSDPLPPAATMAGVGRVMKLVRQVIGNWKVGKTCELALNCVDGVMKVTLSADLGRWVQPQPHAQPQHSETGDRDHQGPRRRAGPSHPPTPAPLSAPARRGRRRDPAPPAPPAPVPSLALYLVPSLVPCSVPSLVTFLVPSTDPSLVPSLVPSLYTKYRAL